MAERIKNGLLVNPSNRDFQDALAGLPTPISEKVRTKLAQAADVSVLNSNYFNPFLANLHHGDPEGSEETQRMV